MAILPVEVPPVAPPRTQRAPRSGGARLPRQELSLPGLHPHLRWTPRQRIFGVGCTGQPTRPAVCGTRDTVRARGPTRQIVRARASRVPATTDRTLRGGESTLSVPETRARSEEPPSRSTTAGRARTWRPRPHRGRSLERHRAQEHRARAA